MTFPAARLTDVHLCNLPAPPSPAPPPPAPIPIIAGTPKVLIGNLPAARMLDMTASVPPHPIAKGSMKVMAAMLPLARMTDIGMCGGMILKGDIKTLVGG